MVRLFHSGEQVIFISYHMAERIAQRGFYIPGGPVMTDAQIEIVVSGIKEILQ